MPDLMFSVLILTLNEEQNLPHCLASLADCDDIVVLDSGSVDRTVEIATESRARVFTRRFDDFAGQRNFAQREVPFRHPWVFHLDADERLTSELIAECRSVIPGSACDGFFVAPKMIFRGRWIPRCTDYPAFQARLVRAPEFKFIQVGHGQREAPDMRMSHLRESYTHHLPTTADASWLEKHERYAREEALACVRDGNTNWRDLAARESLTRRRALKRVSHRLPCRPQLRFLYQYIWRRGFLDGSAGLGYCRLLARYERLVSLELRRARSRGQQ